jgi:hypothetical protein
MEDLTDLTSLVHVDIERKNIDADAWLASLSPWYRPACAAIVHHWERMLEDLDPSQSNNCLRNIQRAAATLSPPAAGIRRSRGVVEWRHPQARPEDDPSIGLCWVGDASSGTGGIYLCWVPLFRLDVLGGAHWTRALAEFTPRGGGAEDVVAYVLHQLALEGSQK